MVGDLHLPAAARLPHQGRLGGTEVAPLLEHRQAVEPVAEELLHHPVGPVGPDQPVAGADPALDLVRGLEVTGRRRLLGAGHSGGPARRRRRHHAGSVADGQEGHRPVGVAPGVEQLPAQQQAALTVDVEALPEAIGPHQLHRHHVGGAGGHVGAGRHRQAVLGGGRRPEGGDVVPPQAEPAVGAVDHPAGAGAHHLVAEAEDAAGAVHRDLLGVALPPVAPLDGHHAVERLGLGRLPGPVEELDGAGVGLRPRQGGDRPSRDDDGRRGAGRQEAEGQAVGGGIGHGRRPTVRARSGRARRSAPAG